MDPKAYLLVSAILFILGVEGFILRRNLVVILMSIELMLNSANLTLVTFARSFQHMDGQVVAFFIMALAAAETAVGLAIIIAIFRLRRTVSADDMTMMKG